MSTTTIIGTIRIPKGTTFRNESSYAAWYSDGVTIEEQTVDVHLSTGGGTHWVTYSYEGVCVASDYSAHYGGVAVGSKVDSEVGKRITHTVQTYDYSFAEAVSRDSVGYRFRLADNVGVRVKGIALRHGAEYAMYGFCARDALLPEQATINGGRVRLLSEREEVTA